MLLPEIWACEPPGLTIPCGAVISLDHDNKLILLNPTLDQNFDYAENQ